MTIRVKIGHLPGPVHRCFAVLERLLLLVWLRRQIGSEDRSRCCISFHIAEDTCTVYDQARVNLNERGPITSKRVGHRRALWYVGQRPERPSARKTLPTNFPRRSVKVGTGTSRFTVRKETLANRAHADVLAQTQSRCAYDQQKRTRLGGRFRKRRKQHVRGPVGARGA